MKRLLLFLALFPCFLQAQTQAATTWPHNPETGEIEMRGLLPWPDSSKTELQRRHLVQHWHTTKLIKLLEDKPLQPSKKQEPSYGVPLAICLSRYQAATPLNHVISVVCQVKLLPTPSGLAYQFTGFTFNWWEDDAGGSTWLDQLILTGPESVKAKEIIATARKRLAVLSSW
jgi:hypothetical protein